MQAQRAVLHTDNHGILIESPVLVPNATIEAIFLIQNQQEKPVSRHSPAAALKGAMTITGDILSPMFSDNEIDKTLDRSGRQLAGEAEAFK